jgi:hypothetical protein
MPSSIPPTDPSLVVFGTSSEGLKQTKSVLFYPDREGTFKRRRRSRSVRSVQSQASDRRCPAFPRRRRYPLDSRLLLRLSQLSLLSLAPAPLSVVLPSQLSQLIVLRWNEYGWPMEEIGG